MHWVGRSYGAGKRFAAWPRTGWSARSASCITLCPRHEPVGRSAFPPPPFTASRSGGRTGSPVAPALLQSSTFVNPVGSDEEVLYSRYGNNPNQIALARKYALLEGAEEAIFVASGMGATALAHLAVLRPGDHLISSSWIYGGTQHLFDQELARFGIEVTYVNPDQPRHWRKALRKSTRAIFVETPDQSAASG